MRKGIAAIIGVLFLVVLTASPAQAGIDGDYFEVRSADVYTGPCVAESEVGLVGNQAILAWHVREGSWNGVRLDGLSVVAVVLAGATLGDPHHNPYPARSVLVFDRQATGEQRQALESFARAEAGRLLENVVRYEAVPIHLEIGADADQWRVRLDAGMLASIHTRSFTKNDKLCGNEKEYYPPLTRLGKSMPVFSLVDRYQGKGLGVTWSRFGKRSGFIGTFSR